MVCYRRLNHIYLYCSWKSNYCFSLCICLNIIWTDYTILSELNSCSCLKSFHIFLLYWNCRRGFPFDQAATNDIIWTILFLSFQLNQMKIIIFDFFRHCLPIVQIQWKKNNEFSFCKKKSNRLNVFVFGCYSQKSFDYAQVKWKYIFCILAYKFINALWKFAAEHSNHILCRAQAQCIRNCSLLLLL